MAGEHLGSQIKEQYVGTVIFANADVGDNVISAPVYWL